MSDVDTQCLDAFPQWLRSLSGDALALANFLENREQPDAARRAVAGGLNYLFKSLDLIPDGIEDLGYIDDAFVMRAAAQAAIQVPEAGSGESFSRVRELAAERGLIAEFLGEDNARFDKFAQGIASMAARGRSVDDIVSSEDVCAELLRDVRSWAQSYQAPAFARDSKNLVKLRSFLRTKLPG